MHCFCVLCFVHLKSRDTYGFSYVLWDRVRATSFSRFLGEHAP